MTKTIDRVLSALAITGALAFATGFARMDNSGGTYGVSVGTDNAYGSVEPVHGLPEVSWEVAK